MNNQWFEWQLIMATVTVLPVVLFLLVAAVTGRLTHSEPVKYIVLLGHDEDYWDTSRAPAGDEIRAAARSTKDAACSSRTAAGSTPDAVPSVPHGEEV